MNPSQAAEILTLAAAYDRRTVGESDARAWALALEGLDPAECAAAVVEHFKTSTDYLMPAHLRRLVDGPEARARKRRAWADAMRAKHGENVIFDHDTEESIAARAAERRALEATR